MSDELKQIVSELAAIRSLLADVIARQTNNDQRVKHQAELAMVDALGMDPVQYLKDKETKRRRAHAKKKTSTAH